jgi:hypothetical protein
MGELSHVAMNGDLSYGNIDLGVVLVCSDLPPDGLWHGGLVAGKFKLAVAVTSWLLGKFKFWGILWMLCTMS